MQSPVLGFLGSSFNGLEDRFPLNFLAPWTPGVCRARSAQARVVELVDTQVSEACA